MHLLINTHTKAKLEMNHSLLFLHLRTHTGIVTYSG